MHNVVLVNGGDMVDANQQENRSWKSWVGVWRTIIRSSLNKTMYPYCHYLRNLNLGELEQILDDLDSKPGVEKKFKTYYNFLTLGFTYLGLHISRLFFQGEGADLVIKTKMQVLSPNRLEFDALATTNRIGTGRRTPILHEAAF